MGSACAPGPWSRAIALASALAMGAGCSSGSPSTTPPDAAAMGSAGAGSTPPPGPDAADATNDAPDAAACATDGPGGVVASEPAAPVADPALAGLTHHYFKISVLDATTRAPLGDATLTLTNGVTFTSDDHGVVAFYEPGLMATDVYFSVARPGYAAPADLFGYHGQALHTDEGAAGEILLAKTGTATAPAASQGDLQTRLLAAPVPAAADCFAIRVVDGATLRGLPLAFLATGGSTYVSDSQGLVAFCDPDHLGGNVTFTPTSPGYRFAAGSVTLDATRGATSTIALDRNNIAERLYRVTGEGIYRDSVLLGLTTPLARPVINGLVMGQDTVDETPYEGKLFWIWGDTERAAYPLGNFRTSGARSELPAPGGAGLAGTLGVDTTYFAGADGFSRAMIEDIAPTSNPTWIGSLLALPVAAGGERLFAVYTKPDSNLATLEAGLVQFDEAQQLFVRAGVTYPLTGFVMPGGQPSVVRHADGAYVYYGPPLRVPATAEAMVDTSTYETWSALGASGGTKIERAADGTPAYAWKHGALELTPDVAKAAGLAATQVLAGHVADAATGIVFQPAGNGGEAWNEHRKRFVKVVQQQGGSTSFLGELWVLEADTPLGPWVYARKVVTHDDYTFYNPWLHPALQEAGGRVVYFEATYTKSFAGTKTPLTPRYDYNQIMYRLDLDDARLALPAPVYDVGAQAGTELVGKTGLRATAGAAAPAFFAPDRAAPGTVPVSWSGPACAPRTLVVGGTPGTAPIFYAFPPATPATSRPPNAVALWDFASVDGRHTYSVNAAAGAAGFVRATSPVAYVWPSPLAVALPVADFLGDLVADAGDDQCLPGAAGGVSVTLDGSGSRDLAGPITSWAWRRFGETCPFATTARATVAVAPGVSSFVLTVTDADGRVSTDDVVVRVAAP